jgi:hypothetical protein
MTQQERIDMAARNIMNSTMGKAFEINSKQSSKSKNPHIKKNILNISRGCRTNNLPEFYRIQMEREKREQRKEQRQSGNRVLRDLCEEVQSESSSDDEEEDEDNYEDDEDNCEDDEDNCEDDENEEEHINEKNT